jgi:hypothetical protein
MREDIHQSSACGGFSAAAGPGKKDKTGATAQNQVGTCRNLIPIPFFFLGYKV